VYRALEDRQYAGAYSAALVLGLLSLALVLGAEWLRNRGQH
jgi:sulfate transport system permease protein